MSDERDNEQVNDQTEDHLLDDLPEEDEAKPRVHRRGARNLLILGVMASVLIVSGGYFVFSGGPGGSSEVNPEREGPDGESGEIVGSPDSGELPDAPQAGDEVESERVRELREEQERERREQAEFEGRSYVETIPVVGGEQREGRFFSGIDEPEPEQEPEQSPQGESESRGFQPVSPESGERRQAHQSYDEDRAERYAEALGRMSGSSRSGEVAYHRPASTSGGEEVAMPVGEEETGASQEPAGQLLIEENDIAPAVLISRVSSDHDGSPVLAEIVGGPLRGAIVRGQFSANHDHVTLEFTRATHPDTGASYDIQAVAVDDGTRQAALAGDVNRRWIERIGIPAAARFLGAYGEGVAMQGSTTTTSPFGGTVQEIPEIDDVGAYAGGRAMEDVADDLREEASQVPREVSVDQGRPIGVLFMAPVHEGDEGE